MATLDDIDLDFSKEDWQDLVDSIIILVAGAAGEEEYSSAYLFVREAEEQQSLIEDGHYASAVIRQSTFYERLLTVNVVDKLEEMNERELYGAEEGFIANLGHRNRIQLAHLLGVVDQRERDILLDMAGWRNTVAHEWWYVAERENKEELCDIATTVVNLLCESLEELFEEADDDSVLNALDEPELDE
ncbi:hypothetical protein [Halorubrum sp. Ea8]|uniref:hypothetical protein n=1 Tax=Halorubrum sp. Ea8 TaxID=1383841 RepID=UPI000B99784D|nr:hypothetical protein [Halorubrum sp. Ea8]OYR46697.1 hypothetical protein DJ74_14305 [Halorubrum sp. Ea8]